MFDNFNNPLKIGDSVIFINKHNQLEFGTISSFDEQDNACSVMSKTPIYNVEHTNLHIYESKIMLVSEAIKRSKQGEI